MATYIAYEGPGADSADEPGLYLVETNPVPAYTCDIFFVHGFGGGPTKSWRHPETGTIWFRDLLPQYVADREQRTNARIWTFGYDSGLFNSTRASIYDYANQLLSRVAGVREDHEHHKIIWVCHSLGGLVVKSALVGASLSQEYRSILQSTSGIIFLGTPHQGSTAAHIAAIIARLVIKPSAQLLRAITRDSDSLDLSAHQFTQICGHIRIHSFHELSQTGGNLIVERSSALLNLPNEGRVGLTTDHVGLSKFSGHRDQNFVAVRDPIRKLIRLSHPIITPERPLPAPPQEPPRPGPSSQQPSTTINLHPRQPEPNLYGIDPRFSRTQPPPAPYQYFAPPEPVPIPSRRGTGDISGLIREFMETGCSDASINTLTHLSAICESQSDHVANAANPHFITLLVDCLSSPLLSTHSLFILARVLYHPHTWTAALHTQAIPLFVDILSHGNPDEQQHASCALANLTRSDLAKETAARNGAIPPLTRALGSHLPQIKKFSVRAVKHILASDYGISAAIHSPTVQALIPLIDDAQLTLSEQMDAVVSLAAISSHHPSTKNVMKQAGLFNRLKRFKRIGVAENLREPAVRLRDSLR